MGYIQDINSSALDFFSSVVMTYQEEWHVSYRHLSSHASCSSDVPISSRNKWDFLDRILDLIFFKRFLPFISCMPPLLIIFLVQTWTLVSNWVCKKILKPILLVICSLTVFLLFKWARLILQFYVCIYCTKRLFFPSPVGYLGRSMRLLFLVAAPCFWHEG